jgi:hypothetical protein
MVAGLASSVALVGVVSLVASNAIEPLAAVGIWMCSLVWVGVVSVVTVVVAPVEALIDATASSTKTE